MLIDKATITNYNKRPFKSYHFTINAYWVTVTDMEGNEIYSRNPNNSDWLDDSHKAITKAIDALDNAITNVLP